MPLLDRNGVKIHYEIHGKGAPVLLSHGYSASSRMWDAQVAALSKTYQTIVWDMRGHGKSDYPKDRAAYSADLTVDDMAAILDAAGVRQAVIAGLSLGGYMSLAFQLKYPRRVRALMLFDTGPGFKNDQARTAWNASAEKRAEDFDAKGLAALGASDEVRISQHRDATGLAGAARGMLAQQDDRVIRSLDKIAVPSLVLVGADDTNFLAATDYMAGKIRNSRKVVIQGAGHAANLHQPEAFNRAMSEFLGGLPKA